MADRESNQPISVPTESRPPDEPMQDIRGEVGFIAKKFGLSADATEAIYAMFCGQAARWEAKVKACEDRIRNQREEIKKLAASSPLLPVGRQIQVQCEMCDGTGQMHVTHDMAIDAGNLNLSGQLISCGTCGGDGFKIEQAEPNENEKLASLPVGESRCENCAELQASNDKLIQMYADLSNGIRPNDKPPKLGTRREPRAATRGEESMKFPEHKCGLFLTHNEHRDYYEPLAEYLKGREYEDTFESPEAMQRAIDTDEHWHLQWYPETPVGFIHVSAPTLAEVLKLANPDELPSVPAEIESTEAGEFACWAIDLVKDRIDGKEPYDEIKAEFLKRYNTLAALRADSTRTQEKPKPFLDENHRQECQLRYIPAAEAHAKNYGCTCGHADRVGTQEKP